MKKIVGRKAAWPLTPHKNAKCSISVILAFLNRSSVFCCGIHNYATQKGNYFLHAHQPLLSLVPVEFAQDLSAIAHMSFLSSTHPHTFA